VCVCVCVTGFLLPATAAVLLLSCKQI